MDNFEKLISSADPVKNENIGDAGPLRLQEPIPVFTQRQHPIRTVNRPNWWRIFATGTTVTAVAAGIIAWSPWSGGPSVNQPAAPQHTNPPVDPSSDPSQSASIDDMDRPKNDYGLPNYLVPAHQNVYFEESEACNKLDATTINLKSEIGNLGPLPGSPIDHPVIGCYNGIATLLTSDIASDESAAPGTVPDGILVARWKAGQWSIDTSEAIAPNDGPLRSWPQLRAGDTTDGIPSALSETFMANQLEDLGINQADSSKLMGPNVPSWMDKKVSSDFHEYGNRLLTINYPFWELRETISDENGNPIAEEKGIELTQVARYDLKAFDTRGKQVFDLTSVKKGSIVEPPDCSGPKSTYTLDGESPSGLVADSGPLKLAVVTIDDGNGVRYSQVGLFPESLPRTGNSCDVHLGIDAGERTLYTSTWTNPMGFKNQAELDAYLKSPEYMDAKKVAAGLSRTPPQG